MLIDLSCPAEVFRTDLPTESIPAASVLMFNLSDRVIVSAEVSLRLLSVRGEEVEKLMYRGRALNGRPRSTFSMTVPCTPSEEAVRADVTIEKVWFVDNAVWRRNPADAVEYVPNELPLSRGLTALRYVAGESAVGYPSQQEGLWVCVCGRPNADSLSACARCGRVKEVLFARCNREAVEKQIFQKERQLELQSRSAVEDTSRLQHLREAEYNASRRRKRARGHLAVGMLCALLAVALCSLVLVPAARLWAASQLLERGELRPAEKVLRQLSWYPGASGMLDNCLWLQAARTAENSTDPSELAEAAGQLRGDPSREDGARLANLADFRRAELLLEAKDFAGASAATEALPAAYPGLSQLQNRIVFDEAVENMNQGYYVLARNAFLTLGSFEQSDVLANRCIYDPCLTMIENGEYDAAIRQLRRIEDFEDSRELISKCWYLKGYTLENAGSYEAAIAAYAEAGDYEDAASRWELLINRMGETAFEAGEYQQAMDWFSKLPDSEAAREEYYAVVYTLVLQSVKDLENRRALELMDLLPEGYEDTDELRARAMTALGIPITPPPPEETPQPSEEPSQTPPPEESPKPEESAQPEESPTPTPTPTPSPTKKPTPTPAASPTPRPAAPQTDAPATPEPGPEGTDFLVQDEL